MTQPRRSLGVLLVVVFASGVLGCGASTPTAPSPSLTGTWSGPMTGDASGTGTARLQLVQTGSGVSGTFTTTMPDPKRSRSGSVGGTALGSTLTITLMPTVPELCVSTTLSGTLTATLTVAADRVAGSYSGFTCGGAVGGMMDLQRE